MHPNTMRVVTRDGSLSTSSRGNSRQRILSFRPQVERLEDRLAPALSVTDLTTLTPNDLVSSILGPGVTVTNVQYTGNSVSAGAFTGGANVVGFESGIILSTGKATSVVGVSSDFASTDNGLPGDAQLGTLSGTTTFDATVLQFSFIPKTSAVGFQYVFASEEYPDFVGSQFNDVFAFFLNGSNVALIPGTNIPVTINNVNAGANSQFFVNNTTGVVATSMNGLTTVLFAIGGVVPNQVNTIRMAIADASDAAFDSNVFIKAGSFGAATQFIAAAPDAGGGPEVKVFNPQTKQPVFDFFAYTPDFLGGVRVALGDVNGDGVPDIVTGPGPGGGPHIKVFDGTNLNLLYSFYAFNGNFNGGVYVAAGDINGDNHADIIVGADAGGGPRVQVFSGKDGSLMRNFFAYDKFFLGGVRVAAADLNGDGIDDIITGAGPGGGPHVKAFDGRTGAQTLSFFAYDPGFMGGVYVAPGNFNQFGALFNIGTSDIITGPGVGGGPNVRVFDGRTAALQLSFMAAPSFLFFGDEADTQNGLRVAAADLNGGIREILTAYAAPHAPTITAFDQQTTEKVDEFFAFDPNFSGGIFIAAS